MNNINTQVSPRNGVDFSKIRKGQQISKFSIGGITHINGDWYNTIFSAFREQMMLELSNAKTPEEKLRIIEKYNNQQSAYGRLRPLFTNLSSVDYNKAVEDYQNLINTDFGFVNSLGINNGITTNRYRKIGTTNRIGKDLSDKWVSDGYWAGQTQDRTTLGYKGDWDENSDTFKAWQQSLNDLGMETYLDSDNTYKLRLLQTEPQQNKTDMSEQHLQSTGGLQESSSLIVIPGKTDYTPDQYTKPFKFKPQPFTSPITNGVIAGLGLAANRRVYNNEMQKKVPLLEAPHHHYTTGSYKTIVDAYDQAGSEIQTQANVIASNSSDLRLSQNILLAGAKEAVEKRLEGALKLQEGYNLDRKEALNVAYFNSDAANRIANINRLNLVADWNRRMDAKSKYLLQRNAIIADMLMKIRTDYGNWKANEENERDAALNAYNQHLANLDMQDAKKPYQNLLANPTQSNAFNQVYSNAFRDFNSRRETDPNWITANRDLVDIFKTGTDVDKRNAFLTYLQTHGDSDYGKLFTQGYNSELTTLKNKYIQDATDIQNDLSALAPSFRNTYTTEGWYNPKRLGQQYQRRFAEGGILKMKRGSRFVDYLEHNRKALKDQKHTTMENAKQAQKALKQQLDAIDRETLILLRSIFK